MSLKLTPPSARYKESFIEALKELQKDSGDIPGRDWSLNIPIPELEKNFETFTEKKLEQAHEKNLPEGYVPQSNFWLVDNGDFIGKVNIRPKLTEYLKNIGGHIGYSIRPSKRRMGYGTKILAMALPLAKEMGMSRVLLTCDETNIGSRKIIEANGGRPENKVPNPKTGIDKLRFWINL